MQRKLPSFASNTGRTIPENQRIDNYKIKSGNYVGQKWGPCTHKANGKVDLLGIVLLAEILYWYRLTPIEEATTGKVLGYKKKFKADLLQRSIDSFAQKFGASKRQVTDALTRLERAGFIFREMRTIDTELGKVGNVLFVAPIMSNIAKLDDKRPLMQSNAQGESKPIEIEGVDIPLCNQTHKGMQSNEVGYGNKRIAYTKNTTKISTENTAASDQQCPSYPQAQAAEEKTAAAFSVLSQDFKIGKVLTAQQISAVRETVNALIESHRIDAPYRDYAVEAINSILLDQNAYKQSQQQFAKKLNTIRKQFIDRKLDLAQLAHEVGEPAAIKSKRHEIQTNELEIRTQSQFLESVVCRENPDLRSRVQLEIKKLKDKLDALYQEIKPFEGLQHTALLQGMTK